jgi:hypothetical protein
MVCAVSLAAALRLAMWKGGTFGEAARLRDNEGGGV